MLSDRTPASHPPTRIRLAEPADLDGIFTIYDREVLHGLATFETVPKSPAQRLEWFAAHAPDRYPCLVAEQAGAIVGWAGVSPWSQREAYARTAENSVYTSAVVRNQGLGTLLLRALITRVHEDTAIRVIIARIVQPNPASNRLHERLGFHRIGLMRRCGMKFGQLLDVLLMDLHLDQVAEEIRNSTRKVV